MLINREFKHLHTHVPKNGGESLTFMLQKLGWNKKDDKILNLGAHASLGSFKNNLEFYEIIKDYHKTTMIRNPWEHAVSFYRHALHRRLFLNENFFNCKNFNSISDNEKLNQDVSFERFIKTGYRSRCQSVFIIEFEEMGLKFDEWFDYHEYDSMLSSFEKRFNIKIDNNIRTHDKRYLDYIIEMDFNKPYQEFYNEETYEIVKNLSNKEISIFDYKF
mgnify:CR=1 FL=1